MANERACISCKLVTYEKQCPVCGSKTSETWSGQVVVLNPDESDIAKELNIKLPGRYAIKVRDK